MENGTSFQQDWDKKRRFIIKSEVIQFHTAQRFQAMVQK